MRKKITLKHIAKELDIAVSTVSKALKDSPEISEDTKQKVQAFAKLFNYKPNNIALSLKNRKTKNIAVIIPEIVHHFFATVIKGIEDIAIQKGYNVLVCLSNESFDKEVINMEMLANGSIDGFILSLSKETQQKGDFHHIQEVINQGMPVVMFDRVDDNINCDKVIIDDQLAAYKAVRFLIDKNKKNIGLITTIDYVSVGRLRTLGYLQALESAGFLINQNAILKIENEATQELQIEKFIKDHQFDAVFAVNELYALQTIKSAQKLGLSVPKDIAVIGFTDGIISICSTPSITTVAQNELLIGKKSAYMLIEKLENEEDNDYENYRTEVLDTFIIEREST